MPKVWRVWLLARSACIVRLVGVKRDARLIDSQDVIEARDVGGNLREVAHTRLDNERWLKIDDHLTARSRQRLQTSQNRLPPRRVSRQLQPRSLLPQQPEFQATFFAFSMPYVCRILALYV